MIAKHMVMNVAAKSSFFKLVRYLTDAQGKQVRTGAVRVTNCFNDSAEVASLEVLNTQIMNTRSAADKTYHLIISFRSNERPEAATLAAIEDRLCDGLGFAEHQRVSVVHDDTHNLHLHVAINKIHPTRYTIREPFQAYWILAKLCDKLENELGLQKDNHTPRQVGAENRASDMEHHAGIESLLGWIKRECKEQMVGAQSWDQLHAALAENGLHIHPRANGLVITADNGTTVKASSVGREFSKPKLEQRLGPFQAASGRQIARKPARCYQKKPLASNVDTTALYARYRTAQADVLEGRAGEREQARARKERRVEEAKRSVHLKRAAIKLASMPRPAKKLMYSALTRALGEEIAAIKGSYQRERQAIDQKHRRSQWTDWLRREAETGDLQALAALRGRKRQGNPAGNSVTGPAPPHRPLPPSGHDSVTRKGTIIYSVGKGAIRDDGARLKVSVGADQDALQCALQMAIARYGERIAVNGSDAFREQVLMAAVAGRLRVTFADAALEQRRLQWLRASTTTVDSRPAEGGNATRTTQDLLYRSGRVATVGYDSNDGAVDRYIAEREQKRVGGFDILKHARYTALDAGVAAYAGTRRVDGQVMALLRQGSQVKMLEVDAATAQRLGRLQLGARVDVSALGVIRAKGRSR